MPSSIRLVRAATHAGKSWKPVEGYGFARASLTAPIAAEEVALATTHFPMAFLAPPAGEAKAVTQATALVAVLGLRAGENLFVAPNGRWAGDYVPAVLRSYPFKLLTGDDGNFHLGYDEASGLLAGAGEGEPFFTGEGKPAERMQQLVKFLNSVNSGLTRTARAGARLAEAGVLEPWPLKLREAEGEVAVTGLLRVSETRGIGDGEAEFLALRHGGALAIAYAQLLSMSNMALLGKLARSHQQHAATLKKQQAEISSMFNGDTREDEIDWAAMLKDD